MYHRSCEVLAYIIDGVFLLSLITGIVLCNLLIGMNYTYENIESIQRNFALTPIFDLSIEEQCAGTKKAAELDIWPGTVQGCQSIKNHLFTATEINIKRGTCSHPGRLDILVKPQKPSAITFWRGKQFCAKSMNENYSYYNLLLDSVKEGEKCPTGKKQCGILDTLKNKLCLDESEDCPVNYIEITATNTPPKDCVNCKTAQLGTNSYIHYGNENIDNEVITNFKISDDNQNVCLDSSEYNSDAEPYTLDYYSYYGCKNSFASYLYDDRYSKVDREQKYTLYDENGILLKVSQLPEYPLGDLKTTQVTLFKRTYPGYDLECIAKSKFNPEKLDNYRHNTKVSKRLNIAVLVFVCINFFVSCFIFSNKLCCQNFYDEEDPLCWIIVILNFITFILAVASYGQISSIKQVGSVCGDLLNQALTKEIQEDLDLSEKFLIVLFSLPLIFIFIYFIDDFVYFFGKRCAKKQSYIAREIQVNNNTNNNSNDLVEEEKTTLNKKDN